MITREDYVHNLLIAKKITAVHGNIIECGTWKGGMIAGVATLLGNKRNYHLFDSFEGLPPAKKVDGEKAIAWQNNTESAIYFDNCTADISFAKQAMEVAEITNYQLHKGWFSETTPKYQGEAIALLRLDGDWYDSTMVCLESFVPFMAEGGVVLIDDYYAWEGCTKALHDYLSKNNLPNPIYQLNNRIAYIQF